SARANDPTRSTSAVKTPRTTDSSVRRREGRARALSKQRVIETVVVTWNIFRDALRVFPGLGQQMPGAGLQNCLFAVGMERFDLALALGAKHRTCAVQQAPPGFQQGP